VIVRALSTKLKAAQAVVIKREQRQRVSYLLILDLCIYIRFCYNGFHRDLCQTSKCFWEDRPQCNSCQSAILGLNKATDGCWLHGSKEVSGGESQAISISRFSPFSLLLL
jgi:hypothetical protein